MTFSTLLTFLLGSALNVALIVGGSIVVPHLRRAYELLTELYR